MSTQLIFICLAFIVVPKITAMTIIAEKVDLYYKQDSEYVRLKINLFNANTKEAYINSVTEVFKEIPSDATAELKIEQEQGDDFKMLGVPLTFNLCDFWKQEKTLAPLILDKVNNTLSCPIKPGVYGMDDIKFSEITKIAFEVDPGTYKLYLTFSFDDEYVENILTATIE